MLPERKMFSGSFDMRRDTLETLIWLAIAAVVVLAVIVFVVA